MDINIPLPGEEVPLSEIDPPDIPMPDIPMPDDLQEPSIIEPIGVLRDANISSQDLPPLPPMPPPASLEDDAYDPNRYSPSGSLEDDDDDDLPIENISEPTNVPPLLPPPPPPPSLALLPPPTAPRSPSLSPSRSPSRSLSRSPSPPPQPTQVLGKTQAKKRLLAFSMTKQGGGAGVTFNLAKKPIVNKESAKGFNEDKDESKKKPAKKGTVDKARDTISEIEELKRKEMELIENMQTLHPRWGLRESQAIAAALPLQLAVGEVLSRKQKREAEKRERRRSRSSSEDRRRAKAKREKERRSKKRVLPNNWKEFTKAGHRLHHFRCFKAEVEKYKERERKRHKRSRSRSRSREQSRKKKKSPVKNQLTQRINLLDTPMVFKKGVLALDIAGEKDVYFPEYMVKHTTIRPSITYCENPTKCTRHLMTRKQMMATVPRDIKQIIVCFINGIRAKRLRSKAVSMDMSEDGKCNMIAEEAGKPDAALSIKTEENTEKTNLHSTNKDDFKNVDVDIEIGVSGDKESISHDENEDKQPTKAENLETNELKNNALENVKEGKLLESCDKTKSIEKEIKAEVCSLAHRVWFQHKKEWLIVNLPLEKEEDEIEIEEIDNTSNVIELDLYSDRKRFFEEGDSSKQQGNYKPRSRNISQNSANVINEELEPIIKSAIRSKWDSDYEESEDEKNIIEHEKPTTVEEPDSPSVLSDKNTIPKEEENLNISNDNLGVVPMEVEDDERADAEDNCELDKEWENNDSPKEIKQKVQENKPDPPDVVEKLASEYEEFIKMLGSENQVDESEGKEDVKKPSETIIKESNWEDDTSEKDNSADNNTTSTNNELLIQDSSTIEEQSKEQVMLDEKQTWEDAKMFANRSQSISSARPLDMSNINEVLLKHNILKENLLGKKKKTKVQGSKIKSKSKDKRKKYKKKHKKQSSSDSSSSSSSSSSDSSSSSSSSSSSDSSSTDSSSSSESSSSSSDSSIDLKKLKKAKLKKLKAKLKRKKKKKAKSSSESSDSSDEELKKRKKKKSKEAKKSKKRDNHKAGKVKMAKKKNTNKDISFDEIANSVFNKRLKKKRKKVDDIDEIEPECPPKKKKNKIESKMDEPLKVQEKVKATKSKKPSKEKEKKKKNTEAKKKNYKTKDKVSKDKLVEGELLQKKRKGKKENKSDKINKDLFLGFGESLKAFKTTKSRDIDPGKCISDEKNSGITMTEEDFEITNISAKNQENSCSNNYNHGLKKVPEQELSFLDKGERMTEEDFDETVVNKASNKSNALGTEESLSKQAKKISNNDVEDQRKQKGKTKKDKKKKKAKDKSKSAELVNVTDKKKKKKKSKKIEDLSIGETKLTSELDDNSFSTKQILQTKESVPTVTDTKNKQNDFNEESKSKIHSDEHSSSLTKSKSDVNNWSDDSETRGCFLKHNEIEITRAILDDDVEEKRNTVNIKLTERIPGLGFDSQSDDELLSKNMPKERQNFENNKEHLIKTIDQSKCKFENDRFFDNLLTNSEKISCPITIPGLKEHRKTVHSNKSRKNVSKIKEIPFTSSPNLSEEVNSFNDSFFLEKDSGNEVKLTHEESSADQAELNKLQSEQPNEISDRYSPTLDMDILSACSNEEVNSDMSLDSNDPSLCRADGMLDIPLPPSGLSPKVTTPSLLTTPVPVPVPPPVVPVPAPSFKNILNFQTKSSSDSMKNKTVVKFSNTEFKTVVTELLPNAHPKSVFSDPLKIPMTKKLTFGKPSTKLKPINIFEEDEFDEGNDSNEQGMLKLPKHLEDINSDKLSLDASLKEKEKNDCKHQAMNVNISIQAKNNVNSNESCILEVHNQFENKSTDAGSCQNNLDHDNQINVIFEQINETGEDRHNILQKSEDRKISDITIKKEVLSDDPSNNENVDSSNFDPNLQIKEELESEESESNISQEVSSEISKDEESNICTVETSKIVVDDNQKDRDYDEHHGPKRRENSRENLERSRQESTKDRRRKSRSRSRERRKEQSRDGYRRDSPDRRNRRRDRSRERTRRGSPRDRRRDRSPRGRREVLRDKSPKKSEIANEVRLLNTDKRDSIRGFDSGEKKLCEISQTSFGKQSILLSPPKRSLSPCGTRSSPFRSISPYLKSPQYQRKSNHSQHNRSPSPKRALNRSPSFSKNVSPPRRALSPHKRPLSPQRKRISPQRRPLSPNKRSRSPPKRSSSPHRRSLSPQRRFKRHSKSPSRRPPSPQSPYRSPLHSPSPYKGQGMRLSSPSKRYLSPSRRDNSPWRPPSPPKRQFSPCRRPSSPGKRPPSPSRKPSSPKRRPLSPWRPPSPPNVQKGHKSLTSKSPQKYFEPCGRNPSPLGFKRSLADSTSNDSDLPPIKKITRNAVLSPKRLPLDDRIELELGVKKSPPPPPPPANYPSYQTFYQPPMQDSSQPDVHLPSVGQQRRNSNLVQPPRLDWDASQQLIRKGKSSQVLQIGNILQVVPSEALPLPPRVIPQQSVAAAVPLPVPVPPAPNTPQNSSQSTVVQVGNMLQVVPTPSMMQLPLPMVSPSPPDPPPPPPSVPAPAIVMTTAAANSPLLLPLPVAKKNIKIDEAALRRIEKEKRKKEKELKRQQKLAKHMIRKALLLKDTYPTETERETQEAANLVEEVPEETEVSPEVFVTPPKSRVLAPLPPPPDKGILISPGFREKPKNEKVRKNVSFADGVHPGEGDEEPLPTEEHPHSPPPLPLPNEKVFNKQSKKKRKVKVRIIRVDDGEDDEEDDSTPPPPPPGSPPPMYHYPPPPPGFMYVPPQSFTVLPGTKGLTPLYHQQHSSTTTTHTTTVQYAAPPQPHKAV